MNSERFKVIDGSPRPATMNGVIFEVAFTPSGKVVYYLHGPYTAVKKRPIAAIYGPYELTGTEHERIWRIATRCPDTDDIDFSEATEEDLRESMVRRQVRFSTELPPIIKGMYQKPYMITDIQLPSDSRQICPLDAAGLIKKSMTVSALESTGSKEWLEKADKVASKFIKKRGLNANKDN